MRIIYSFFIFIYTIAIKTSSLFNEKATKWVKGRKNWKEYAALINPENDKLAWFHCASLGEFEQGRPVIEEFKQEFPTWKILITFFSPSGYEIRKNYEIADYIMYLPADTLSNAKYFVKTVKPDIAFFVKYEFWFNYINVLNKRETPIIYFSSIFRPSQHYFKYYGYWFRNQLKKINYFFVQNQESVKLLNSINIMNCSISGDTRFDRVMHATNNTKTFQELEKFSENKRILLCGSTWPQDEAVLEKIIPTLPDDVKIIIAPHNVDEDHINALTERFEKDIIKLSDFYTKDYNDYKILLIDGMGFLLHLYRYAYVAYIGGGFGKSIHNILEAATFGKPVIFGPAYHKFKEAHDLLSKKGAFTVKNSEELKEIITKLFNDYTLYNIAAENCSNYVKENCGATEVIMEKTREILG